MNRKIILTALCAMALCPAFAQTSTVEEKVEYSADKYKVETNRFWSNCFVSLGAGGQFYFGDHDKQVGFGKRIAPAVDIAVGKWFTPGIGVRLMYSGLQSRGATQGVISTPAHSTGKPVPGKDGWGNYLSYSKFYMGNLHVDVMFNTLNLFGGYNENRKWDLSPYVGIGYAWVFGSPAGHEVAANAGILTSWHFSKALALNLDVRAMLANDALDGEIGGAACDGNLAVTLGLTYKFKQRGWNRSKTVYRTDYGDLESMRNKLKNMGEENERIKAALAESSKAKAPVVKKVAAGNLVIFKIGKSTLSKEARANLGLLAEVIKSGDPETVYTITGYADSGTGSDKTNKRLSKERAENVFECLVKEFGVDKMQLRIEYKGGVDNMFYNDPSLSRAVITRSE